MICSIVKLDNRGLCIVKRWIGLTMEYKNRAACREIFMPSIVNPIHLLKYIVTVLCKIVAIIPLLQNSFFIIYLKAKRNFILTIPPRQLLYNNF